MLWQRRRRPCGISRIGGVWSAACTPIASPRPTRGFDSHRLHQRESFWLPDQGGLAAPLEALIGASGVDWGQNDSRLPGWSSGRTACRSVSKAWFESTSRYHDGRSRPGTSSSTKGNAVSVTLVETARAWPVAIGSATSRRNRADAKRSGGSLLPRESYRGANGRVGHTGFAAGSPNPIPESGSGGNRSSALRVGLGRPESGVRQRCEGPHELIGSSCDG